MRVALQKIEGVSAVTVSLNDGAVTLRFIPDNRVTIERIREAIRTNGFAPREAEIRVAGRVIVRGDSLLLVVRETNESYVLEDIPGAAGRRAEIRRGLVGTRVVVGGQVPTSAKQPASRPRRLLVRSFASLPESTER